MRFPPRPSLTFLRAYRHRAAVQRHLAASGIPHTNIYLSYYFEVRHRPLPAAPFPPRRVPASVRARAAGASLSSRRKVLTRTQNLFAVAMHRLPNGAWDFVLPCPTDEPFPFLVPADVGGWVRPCPLHVHVRVSPRQSTSAPTSAPTSTSALDYTAGLYVRAGL